MKKQSRSEARKDAFTLVFQLNQHSEEINEMIYCLLEEKPECEDNLGYISSVVKGVGEKIEELDQTVEKYLKSSWTLKRIPKVAHSVLRLAIFEMKYVEDVPVSVAINEAVEITKTYGDDEEAKFVNGILASVAKEL